MVTIPLLGRLYVWIVFVLGSTVIGYSIYQLTVEPIGYRWLFLAALTLTSGSLTIRLPSVPATISISETFVFTSVLLFGPGAGTLTVALDSLVISLWLAKRQPEPIRLLFNLAAPPLSVSIAAHLFYVTSGTQPLIHEPTLISEVIPSLFLMTTVYFVINSTLTAVAISFERGIHPFGIWRENFLWLSLNYFGGASLAALFVVYTRDITLTYLGILVPLLLVIYLTFKTSMARVEDAKRHLADINTLYLSTIETLAMAIDAKDQVTHGHIRRVQIYATGLAKAVGMTSDTDLRAVEAAALLHDMGKLAIPEHILNKPGKLTAVEFERMKRHAPIGAEILSAIDFPYPVVPIVRHHHENWDGTGYPDGIEGQEIPLGARILSVVDCFDALTSDRPYRPALTTDEAIAILEDRSGSMYDPAIVKTFVDIHEAIAPTDSDVAGQNAITEIMAAELENVDSDTVALGPETSAEKAVLEELRKQLHESSDLQVIGDAIFACVSTLFPPSLLVYYTYEESTDQIEVRKAYGPDSKNLKGLSLKRGECLSGWVGTNRKSIRNSNPRLDLGEVAESFSPQLRSTLSAPVLVRNKLVGIVTLYAVPADAYTERHRHFLETIAKGAASSLLRARTLDHTTPPQQEVGRVTDGQSTLT